MRDNIFFQFLSVQSRVYFSVKSIWQMGDQIIYSSRSVVECTTSYVTSNIYIYSGSGQVVRERDKLSLLYILRHSDYAGHQYNVQLELQHDHSVLPTFLKVFTLLLSSLLSNKGNQTQCSLHKVPCIINSKVLPNCASLSGYSSKQHLHPEGKREPHLFGLSIHYTTLLCMKYTLKLRLLKFQAYFTEKGFLMLSAIINGP